MILVISHHRDEHAQSVMVELSRRGAATRMLDLARFPLDLCLAMQYDGAGVNQFTFGCDDTGLGGHHRLIGQGPDAADRA